MNIICWEAAFSGAAGRDEDRYEESGTSPLSTPVAPKRPRVSISPLGRRSSSAMPRSDSPFSAASQSPAAQQLSSSTANDISELTSEITRLSESVERSTNLVLELQRTLENSIVQMLDAPINADEILNELGAGQPENVDEHEQEQEFL
ncbi:uncharacterized protein LOC127749391 [Frankliniella occidentalis]|uniref:Uncharacterized protein LOC127749391 n=1 Tax=Frankliniella occidentalis TaxID=133901 RepID=A0A9C6WYG9_FRAOC|nr:uncharacterized protein LOC127749391 [Frankliniella occidentalis]